MAEAPEFYFPETLPKLRQLAHDFATDEQLIADRDYAWAHPKEYPYEFMKRAAKLGFLGMDIPEEYGGSAMSPIEAATVMEELSYGAAGFGLDILVQNSLTAFPINFAGTEAQKQKYLPGMARGEILACFGLTEPEYGSDAKNIQLSAEYGEDKNGRKGFWINGKKQFITSASASDIVVLAARTGSEDSREHGISTFIAEIKDNPAVHITQFNKLGQEGSPLCQITFESLFIPEENLLGELNGGWKVIEATLHHSRNWIAAQGLGISRRAYDEAKKYAAERIQFGGPIEQKERIATYLELMRRQNGIQEFLIQKAADEERKDIEEQKQNPDMIPDFFVWSSLSKLVAAYTATWNTRVGAKIFGGMSYSLEVLISHLYKDALILHVYEGTDEIQLKILQKYLNVHPASCLSLLLLLKLLDTIMGGHNKRLKPLFPPYPEILVQLNELEDVQDLKRQVNSWTTTV